MLLAATAFTAASIGPGYAADVTISTNQTNTVILNQILPGGGSIDILSGVTLARGFGSQNNGPRYTVSNAGTVNAPPTVTGSSTTIILGAGGTFTNSGTVNQSNSGSFATVLIQGGTGNNSFTNSGTVHGDIDMSSVVTSPTGTQSITGVQAQTFTNTATGVIDQGIEMSGGTVNAVTNAGKITGAVILG